MRKGCRPGMRLVFVRVVCSWGKRRRRVGEGHCEDEGRISSIGNGLCPGN